MQSVSETLSNHRSIRTFLDKDIDHALTRKVLEEAFVGASSSGNLNSATMILTRDMERRKRLFQLHSEQEMVLEAPLVITFCADWFRTRKWLQLRGARDNFNNFLGYHVAIGDAFILAQNVCLGFESLGLGICYMGTTLFSIREISEFLELPETCVPVTTIVVGYPNENPAKRDRLPLDSVIFEERYTPPSTEELAEIYREREVKGWARYMAMPKLKEMAEEKGITELAQFYTSEIKYDPDYFVPKSKEIAEFLEEKGFPNPDRIDNLS